MLAALIIFAHAQVKVKILEQLAPPSLPPQLTRTKATWMSVMDLAKLDIRFYLKLFYKFTIGSHRKGENIKTCDTYRDIFYKAIS